MDCSYQKMCKLCCHLHALHPWEVQIDLYEQILEMWSISLAPKMNSNYEVDGPDPWQLVAGKKLIWVSSNAQVT